MAWAIASPKTGNEPRPKANTASHSRRGISHRVEITVSSSNPSPSPINIAFDVICCVTFYFVPVTTILQCERSAPSSLGMIVLMCGGCCRRD